ncbi:MAG: flagellar hook-basal body complex protein FliE [Alphaproteobacteria bacterium]
MDAAKAMLAYAQAQQRDIASSAGADAGVQTAGGASFKDMLQEAVRDGIDTAKTGEAMAAAGLNGEAAMVDVVTAISAAEVTVQSAVAVRDRVISAYQEIMRMPI